MLVDVFIFSYNWFNFVVCQCVSNLQFNQGSFKTIKADIGTLCSIEHFGLEAAVRCEADRPDPESHKLDILCPDNSGTVIGLRRRTQLRGWNAAATAL